MSDPKMRPDPYNYISAMRMALLAFEHGARGSGRTTHMLQAVGDHDVILCHEEREAVRLRKALHEAGKKTTVIVVDPVLRGERLAGRQFRGRMFFDHQLVQRFMEELLHRAEREFHFVEQHHCMGQTPQEIEREDQPLQPRTFLT